MFDSRGGGNRSAFSVQILRLKRVKLTLDLVSITIASCTAVLTTVSRWHLSGTSICTTALSQYPSKRHVVITLCCSGFFDLPTARGESIVIHPNFYCLLAKLQSRFALRGGCGVWGDVWSLILSVFRDALKVKIWTDFHRYRRLVTQIETTHHVYRRFGWNVSNKSRQGGNWLFTSVAIASIQFKAIETKCKQT